MKILYTAHQHYYVVRLCNNSSCVRRFTWRFMDFWTSRSPLKSQNV